VPVFYADDAAKSVMVNDQQLISELKAEFGPESYFEDGTLNRKHISSIVFNDEEALAKLNAIVHPATFRAFDNWVASVKDAPYVVKEAALMFESDSYKYCDHTIMVQAPLEMRIQRVMQRDGLSREEIEKREANQIPQEKKAKLADYIIKNDDSELLIPQVLRLHQTFLSKDQ